MVVSGVPIPNGISHAREIACMSLNLFHACQSFVIPHMVKEPLQIRIGLHSGKDIIISFKYLYQFIQISRDILVLVYFYIIPKPFKWWSMINSEKVVYVVVPYERNSMFWEISDILI